MFTKPTCARQQSNFFGTKGKEGLTAPLGELFGTPGSRFCKVHNVYMPYDPESFGTDPLDAFVSESVGSPAANDVDNLSRRLCPPSFGAAMRRWVVASVLAFFVGGFGGFWALRTVEYSAAPGVAGREDRSASVLTLPSTHWPVSRLPPPPSIVIPALPRPEENTAAPSVNDSRSRIAPAPLSPEPATTTLGPPAGRTLSLRSSPVMPTTAASPPIPAVPLIAGNSIGSAPPMPTPELPESRLPSAVVDRGVLTSSDRAAVLNALREYEDAFEGLNVTATAEIWPSVDRRALGRAFSTLKSQGLNFEGCDIAIAESTATANCRGTVEFVRRVGSQVPLTVQQRWVFRLRKVGAEWMIEEVTASPRPASESRSKGIS